MEPLRCVYMCMEYKWYDSVNFIQQISYILWWLVELPYWLDFGFCLHFHSCLKLAAQFSVRVKKGIHDRLTTLSMIIATDWHIEEGKENVNQKSNWCVVNHPKSTKFATSVTVTIQSCNMICVFSAYGTNYVYINIDCLPRVPVGH